MTEQEAKEFIIQHVYGDRRVVLALSLRGRVLRFGTFPPHKPQPYATHKLYRGRVQYVVGYTWHRPEGNAFTGRVYDTALGYGPTWEAAIERARGRVAELAAEAGAA